MRTEGENQIGDLAFGFWVLGFTLKKASREFSA
jgi:hypothetical protein